ncbi:MULTISPECIES: MerR family transcriptional regulator [unclassified Streptomyces]|uniref:MerR family transcriptional regulator n=1 Tax=unclassified Streptomyces TaxID=2593676 RepID=UPI002E1191E0|nr:MULTISPECIES: MerR family transcriptional regulator [unclassified Streptomyces]WSR25775.1 MerR family transcriptional regulator [Streptomyces sp. NBC_01205]
MRIGEIAALVGVTTRAVRHYHHVGLLPEPERRWGYLPAVAGGGYRAYSVRDAVLLARVRRLTELGLSLDEVRDVLADDAGRELADVLEELDADLARQEAAIRERRERLAALRAAPPVDDGPLPPALAALLAQAPETTSPSAALDREHLILLDTAGAGGPELYEAMAAMAADPAVLALYERLDDLADAPTDDPRIPVLAADLVAAVPDGVFDVIPADGPAAPGFTQALLAEYAPAQAEVVRQVMEAFAQKGSSR